MTDSPNHPHSEDLLLSAVNETAPPKPAATFADNWDAMTETQRVDFCVERAQQAIAVAQEAPREMRELHLRNAHQWLDLAKDISLRNLPGVQPPLGREERPTRPTAPTQPT
jgi:hypothetical protein